MIELILNAILVEEIRRRRLVDDEDRLLFSRRRLHDLTSDRKTRWRVTTDDRRVLKQYNKYHDTWEQLLRETSIGAAPWYVVEGADTNYRNLTVGRILNDSMKRINAGAKPAPRAVVAPAPSVIGNVALIRSLNLRQKLPRATYDRDLPKWQAKLARLTQEKRFRDRALILAFEGADAAGKGGAIRRVATSLDARQFVVVPVAAPTEEERAQPFLWRFWRQIPARGGITIFDRTWYGRVLVERVEGYCSVTDWMRAYDEINQFEEQLVKAGIVVCKFWLQISKDEQLKRFEAREKTAFKRFKITQDDWRNRKKWHAYEQAVADMVDRTSTELAPWTLVEAGVVADRTLTSWPSLRTDIENAGGTWVDEQVHVDGNLISSRNPDDLDAFCKTLVDQIAS